MFKDYLLKMGVAVVFSLTLSACSGGSNPSPSLPPSQTLDGTAATGAAIAKNTTVHVKDANGKAANGKISDDAGKFSVDVSGLTPPFVLCTDTSGAATPCSVGTDDKVLFSVTDKVGTANITPLTKLAAASAAGVTDPSILFNTSATLKAITADQITKGLQSITTVVGDYLKAAGVDPATFNPLTTTFIANSKGVDSVLDKVKPSIAANGAVSIAFPGTTQAPVTIPDISKSFASYSSAINGSMRGAWPAVATAIARPAGVPAIIPNNVTIPVGFEIPQNTVLPSNVTIASGVTLPTGVTIPAGVKLPANFTIPAGAVLAANLSLPAGVVIPDGVTLPAGITIPSSASVPSSWQTAPPTGITIPGGITYGPPPAQTSGAPTITSFTPTTGAVGSSVVITGTNFSATGSSNTVKLNGVQVSVTAATATSLTITVPESATSGKITVTTAGVTATSSGSFTVSNSNVTPTPGNGVTFSSAVNGVTNIADVVSTPNAVSGTYRTIDWGNGLVAKISVNHSVTSSTIESLQVGVQAFTTVYGPTTAPGGVCYLIGTPLPNSYPNCSTLGVSFDKAAGTVTFTATPMGTLSTAGNGATAFTMTGTLHFTPY